MPIHRQKDVIGVVFQGYNRDSDIRPVSLANMNKKAGSKLCLLPADGC
jgi:hypothetical protein